MKKISGWELLEWRKKLLMEGGGKSNLDWLLDIGAGLSWVNLQKIYLDPDCKLTLTRSLDCLEDLWHIHLTENTPLQYLVGLCPWRDFELMVSPDVLIPRQETELLIDIALKLVGVDFAGRWADLGTGSGAIAVALSRCFPGSFGYAVDCSQPALLMAEKNLKALAPNATVNLCLGSWWAPLEPVWGSLDLVIANPPYIPTGLIKDLDPVVRMHEPHLALCGGDDGLFEIRKIISGVIPALSSGGWLLLEHHHDHNDAILEILCNFGLKDIHFEKDLQGIRRFAICSHS